MSAHDIARQAGLSPAHFVEPVTEPARDPWVEGLKFDTPQVNRSKHARRARSGRICP